ncbi:MAG: tetratricopeptide repeat protein [Erythrobacter sp.]|nr:tetratricopeptide repeat protein [Erythrobacter sp.]
MSRLSRWPGSRITLTAALGLSLALASCESVPADPFGAAQEAMAKGELRTALELVDAAASQRPDDPAVRMLAGDLAIALGNPDRAVSEFKRVAQGPATNSLAKAKLAEAEVMANYMSAAEQSVAALEFDVPLAYTSAIAYALAKGEGPVASARLAEGLERFPDNPRLVTIDAERLFLQAEPDAAAKRLAPVLAIEPPVPQAHVLAGRMALGRRDPQTASTHFRAALKARPNDQTAMLAMAAIARDKGEEAEALNWISKANQAGDPHPIALLFAAQMAYEAGDMTRAFELVEIVPPVMAAEPDFARLRGFIDVARGQYGAAILPLKAYLETASDDYPARRTLAQAYAEQGELTNAWETIEPVLRDPQAEPEALAFALRLSETTGRGDTSMIRATLAKRQGAADIMTEMRAAGDAIRAGNWAGAEAIYAPLIDTVGSRDAVLLNNAASVKSELGKHAEAVALARRALAEAPESPQVLDTLGWALWREGERLDEARALLTKAAQKAPGNREIAEHWAIAHKDA